MLPCHGYCSLYPGHHVTAHATGDRHGMLCGRAVGPTRTAGCRRAGQLPPYDGEGPVWVVPHRHPHGRDTGHQHRLRHVPIWHQHRQVHGQEEAVTRQEDDRH